VTQTGKDKGAALEWLENRRCVDTMTCHPIPFAESREWAYEAGALRHETGGFFTVEGVQSRSNIARLDGKQLPMINQPEIGILGFLVCKVEDDWRWLLQAKAEPGNVELVQLAPTVQATYSNYMCRHGGAETHYISHFTDASSSFSSDGLHSEQGSRFLRKFNRNMVKTVEEPLDPLNTNFLWFSSAAVRLSLETDYALNTDARSVVATAPWNLISGGQRPFSRQLELTGKWRALDKSYQESDDNIAFMLTQLKRLREEIKLETAFCSLEKLKGWTVDESKIAQCETASRFEVLHYNVEASEREVSQWDQPLFAATDEDKVILFCQEHQGVLKILLRPCFEVGLTGGVEYGPSYKADTTHPPKWLQDCIISTGCRTRAQINQSDEGGRFMRSCCSYSILELHPDQRIPPEKEDCWLTLAQLEKACTTPKLMTNEARSAVSLLLAFS